MEEQKNIPEQRQEQSTLKGILTRPLKPYALVYILIVPIIFLFVIMWIVPKNVPRSIQVAPVNIPIQTTTPNPIVLIPEFKQEAITANTKFFADFDYPKELFQTPKVDLLAMQCIEYSCGDYNGKDTCIYSPPIDKNQDPQNYEHISYEIKQPGILALAKQLLQDYRLVVDPQLQQRYRDAMLIDNPGSDSNDYKRTTDSLAIDSCKTQVGKTIITYDPADGGNLVRLAVFDETGAVEYSATLADGLFVASCSVLQVTSGDIAYVRCAGGDGPSSGAHLYKVDLNKKAVQKILDCNINSLKSDKAVCS